MARAAPLPAAAPRAPSDGAGDRLDAAALALLEGSPCDAGLARAAGQRSTATLERALLRMLGVDAAGLAALGRHGRYAFAYGGPFHVAETLRYLGRDPHNLAERVEGPDYRRYFLLDGRLIPLTLSLRKDRCEVALHPAAHAALGPADRLALHRRLRRFLGLDQPLAAFYEGVRDDPVMGPLVRRLRGVRIPQVPSLWEALCWAIIGQQINLAFAYRLRNRFIALGNGRPASLAQPEHAPADPLPFPGPRQVLEIPEPAWREAQFSRQKAAYLQVLARAFLDGTLDEVALAAAPPEEAAATLRTVKGLGPWSVAYGLLRALGQADALPVGDAGLRAALRHHYALPAAPDARTQEALMEPFRPYRGLATCYFWKSLDKVRQE